MGILDKIRAARAKAAQSLREVEQSEADMLLQIGIRDILETSREDDHENADALLRTLGKDENDYLALVAGVRDAVEAAAAVQAAASLGDQDTEALAQRRRQLIATATSNLHARQASRAERHAKATSEAASRLGAVRKAHPQLFDGGEIKQALSPLVADRAAQVKAEQDAYTDAIEQRFVDELNLLLARNGHAGVAAIPEVKAPATKKVSAK